MKKEEKINKINEILNHYFSNEQNPRIVSAKDMMKLFIKKGVFDPDNITGLPIRKLLRELDENQQLYLIPYIYPERKIKNTYWYFRASKDYIPTLNQTYKKQVAVKKTKSHDRTDSDEYYVIDLCNKVLNRTASQQHKFDFLCGDNGNKLPVDAYYKELNLVIEYHEKQHTESVSFFDKKMTVSGVSRGEQRKIYDERRRKVLPEHGIKLIVINYTDFGNTKKLSRNPVKDTETIRKILSDNKII